MELTLNELKILRNALNSKLRDVHILSPEYDDIKHSLQKVKNEIKRIKNELKMTSKENIDEILDEIREAPFSRFNDWFDSNSESFGELNGERLFSETETKRLCLKLSKELIESVRDNDFHFKNMSTIEVLEYLLK